MNSYTLTEANVLDILGSGPGRNVPIWLVALDYNWGPPISGRFETDFLQIWAAADTRIEPRAVKLRGNGGPDKAWIELGTFQHVKDCGAWQLYLLDAPGSLVTEFVIELHSADGSVYYDNNGGYGVNYRLTPYRGRGTMAVAGDGAIRMFGGFVGYHLLQRHG
jgi:hypothetical protein